MMRGSVTKFQRKGLRDGWRARIDIPESTYTKRKQISKVFDTKKEAEQWIAKKKHDIYSGAYIEPSNMLLKDWLREWLESYAKSEIRKTTLIAYQTFMENHTIPHIGDIPLSKLSATVIQKFYNQLLEDGKIEQPGGLAASSIRYHIHAPLRKALQKAFVLRYIPMNPCDQVTVPNPQKDRKEITFWNREQVRRFLQRSKESSSWIYYVLFYTAIMTGMRKGELLGLRWQDIDFKEGKIAIRQIIARDPQGGLHFNEPKTKSGKRVISIDRECLNLLRKHKEYMNRLEDQLGSEWKGIGLVFSTAEGKIINASNIRRAFNKLIKQVDNPKITFHDLRHTHATLMLENGTHPKIVSERLGHSSITITLDLYSHALPDLQDEAASSFAESLFEINDEPSH